MNSIEQAKEFATQKFAEVDVENHFLEVYSFLKDDFDVQDEKVLIAGLLHDVLEDTNTSNKEIIINFGEDVLHLILEVSHPKNWKDEERPERTKQDLMKEYYKHIKEISDEAKLIKIADFTSHMNNFIKIYQKEEQHLYPKFVNNDKYVEQIQEFLKSCPDSLAKEHLWNLAEELKVHLK
ncbi:MAG: HD domain-containing protein [Candidatus Paceibacterota bacterium]